MNEFLKSLAGALPTPVTFAIAVFVVGAWAVREFRGYASNGPLFRDRWVHLVFLLCAIGACGYYCWAWLATDVQFSSQEVGVYVYPFMNDPMFEMPSQIEAAVASAVDRKQVPNVKVFVSRRYPPDQNPDLYALGNAHHATLVVSGARFQGGDTWTRITNLQLRSERWLKPKFDPTATAEAIQADLLDATGRRSGEVGSAVGAKVSTSESADGLAAISTLKYRLDDLTRRIASVETLGRAARPSGTPEAPTPNPKTTVRSAVVIGINKYGTPATQALGAEHPPTLQYPVEDARSVQEVLSSRGYPQISTLLDGAATKVNIRAAIDRAGRQTAGSNDMLLIYYAGHAVVQKNASGEEMGYLLPADFTIGALESTAISATELRQWVAALPVRRVAVLVDGCYGGSFGHDAELAQLRSVVVSELRPSINLVPPAPNLWRSANDKVLVVLSAATRNQTATEGPQWGHGLFTYFVLSGLAGAADLNGDSEIAADELYAYVYPKIANASVGKQTPVLDAVGTSTLSLALLKTR